MWNFEQYLQTRNKLMFNTSENIRSTGSAIQRILLPSDCFEFKSTLFNIEYRCLECDTLFVCNYTYHLQLLYQMQFL